MIPCSWLRTYFDTFDPATTSSACWRDTSLARTDAEMQGVSMNGMTKHLAATFLSAAMLFTTAAQAMEIRQFDKMAERDQAEYVGLLVQSAEQVLIDEGRNDLQQKVHKLFSTTLPGDNMTVGQTEFERNLALLRVADVENAQKNPKDPRIEVEDAMVATLHKNHIELPDSFFTVNSGFKPKLPPQTKDVKKKDDKKKN